MNTLLHVPKKSLSFLTRPCGGYRAVAAFLKVVRRRKPSSAEGTRGGRAREGDYSPLVRGFGGPPPRKVLNFERFYVRF